MDAGRLDRAIVIEQGTASTDSFGQERTVWTDWQTGVRAEFMPGAGSEAPAGKSVIVSATPAVFRIRWRKGMDPKTRRIRFDGEVWEIKSIAEVGRRHFLDITAVAHELKSGS